MHDISYMNKKTKYEKYVESREVQDANINDADFSINQVNIIFNEEGDIATGAYISPTAMDRDKVIELLLDHNPDIEIR